MSWFRSERLLAIGGQTSVMEQTHPGGFAQQSSLMRGQNDITPPRGNELDPTVVGRPQSRVCPELGRLSSALE